ncbi:unnamed protein product [Ectocarpus sp. 6 AP-2014]
MSRRGSMDSRSREVKVVLLGDTGVGKSSLVHRFVTNNFKPYSESTIGASFMSKMIMVDGSPMKFQIWDTAGQEKYHSLAPMYYRGAGAAIVVYDITKMHSFRTLKEWINELQAQGPQDIAIAVAGNKRDLESQRTPSCSICDAWSPPRAHSVSPLPTPPPVRLGPYSLSRRHACRRPQEVESSMAQAYADEIGAMFVETSAKDATHVQDMFVELSKRLPKREPLPPASGVDLNLDSSRASSSCC